MLNIVRRSARRGLISREIDQIRRHSSSLSRTRVSAYHSSHGSRRDFAAVGVLLWSAMTGIALCDDDHGSEDSGDTQMLQGLSGFDAFRSHNTLITMLEGIVGPDNVTVDKADRIAHGKPYNSYHKMNRSPDVVVSPTSTEEVSEVVKLCAAHKIPVVPYGGATSLEGHLLAPDGGVSIDFTNMREIRKLNHMDHDVTIQAGIPYLDLNTWLRQHGLWFPLDPGPGATLGGMAACRCSGSTAVRYGTMRENVINITAVLPNGDIIKTGGRAKKSAAGYDLTRLLVGSEGTLAVITELTIRVHKIPSYSVGMRVTFGSIAEASHVVQEALAQGIQLGRAEMMDNTMIGILNKANGTSHELNTTVLFEFAGESQAAVLEMQEQVTTIANKYRPTSMSFATDANTCKEMWMERKEALWTASSMYPDKECMITDVCVPLSRLADVITESKEMLDASWLPAPIVAHAGDGNFHAFLYFDPHEPRDVAEAKRLSSFMVDRALAMEGTCTGEHGIGYGKIKYLQKELGHPTIKALTAIKNALDPDNIMNPGKVLPHRRDPATGKLIACS